MSTNDTQSLRPDLKTRNAEDATETVLESTEENTEVTETDAILKSERVSQAVKDSVDREKVLPKKSGRGGTRRNAGRKKASEVKEEPPSAGEVEAESQAGVKKVELTLQQIIDKVWKRKDREEAIRRLVERATKGDINAAKLLLEYRFGKPGSELREDEDDSLKTDIDEWRKGAAARRSQAEKAIKDTK